MRYIIDKGDLYLSNTGDIIIGVNDIIELGILPLGCYPPIRGKVISVKDGSLVLDSSSEFKSCVQSHSFKNIYSLKIIESAFTFLV